jgi:bifunctional UDP-N-acetylglucosamine pyrophosphorylase/glucosamine-1-phosphate N-acetyltransferase
LAWGRIVRDKDDRVLAIIEQKDATKKQRKIKELNTSLYCFKYDFLKSSLPKIEKSPFSKEYYLTDLAKIAVSNGEEVVAVKVPFKYVGIGVNTQEEFIKSKKLFKKIHKE